MKNTPLIGRVFSDQGGGARRQKTYLMLRQDCAGGGMTSG